MGLMRSLFLSGSESVWLREHAMRWPFVQRATRRFMPGERLEDALLATRELNDRGIGVLLTHLGENLTTPAEAAAVADHYIQVQERARETGLGVEISLKLTQLGLELGVEEAQGNLVRVANHAARIDRSVWVDMEQSGHVDATLDLYRRLRGQNPNLGVCLQAYLRRTAADLDTLLPLGAQIRLVKGAYQEPPSIAFSSMRDVNESFFGLATRLMGEEARAVGGFVGFGTHDVALIQRIQHHVAERGVPREAFEFEMLYGVRRGLQTRLAADGYRVRVLISYGASWFPWYMRRLAERPANVWFVVKSMFAQ